MAVDADPLVGGCGDLPALAAACGGLSGAEVDQAIVSALYDTAGSGMPPDQAALCRALEQTRPLSVLMREQVQALRGMGARALRAVRLSVTPPSLPGRELG